MSVKSKSLLFAIILALVAVSTISIIMTDRENSSAETYYVSTADDLVNRVTNAVNGDVIIVRGDIELNNPLRITKSITLATDNGATISPSATFKASSYTGNRGMTLIHVDSDNYAQDGVRIGKLTLGLNTNPENNEILTLDGGGKCRVIHAEMRRSPAGPTLTINSGVITNGYHTSNAAGVYLDRASVFVMNGGSITGNHIEPSGAAYNTDFRFSEDLWIGSGVQSATINGGEIGNILVRAHSPSINEAYSGKVTLNGGSIGTIYLDYCYRSDDPNYCLGSVLNYGTGSIEHLLISTSKKNSNDPTTFRYSEVYQSSENPLSGNYSGGSHVAMVNDRYGYTSLEDAVNAAGDGDRITIIGDCDLSSLVNVAKDITIEIGDYVLGTGTNPYSFNPNNFLNFKVSIDMNGGVLNSANWTNDNGTYTANYAYGTQISDIVNSLEAPERTGYRFTGWSYTDGAIGTVSANITANYTVNSYKIHLHHGTDGFSHGAATVHFDSDSVLIHEIPKKIGHRLVGYFTHETDGTMVLNADGTFASDNVDDHITDGKWSKAEHHTLYAQWELDESSNINPMIIIIATAIEAAIVIGITALVRRR